jgi:hypothetical protein
MAMKGLDPSSWRKAIVPMTATASIAVLCFFGLFAVDHFFTGGPGGATTDPVSRYLRFDPDHITDAVSSLGGMIAAVLGIVITVVSIVVQLSAERYHGVAGMFMRDRINITVMGYYIVTCVCGVLVSLSVHKEFAPRATLVGMMCATMFGLVLMAPYFAYVFWFLEPTNIITRIRTLALSTFRAGAVSDDDAQLQEAQQHALQAMEELTDISNNSIEGKDKIIASGAVDAIKDFTVGYLRHKKRVREEWFQLSPQIRMNPDVVALDPEAREELVGRRTWVEWKAMRQYLGIYNEALAAMPDINHLIAIDTRYIGEAAADASDEEAILLTFRYMNSYLRATLNARNVRTAYNVLNQYRQLVEAMMRKGLGRVAAGAVEHLKYYGHVSYDMKLPFVTETIAYDMGNLCEVANQVKLPEEDQVLATFLELDRASQRRGEEQALKGVRKAQAKLAAFYLLMDDRQRARLIFRDMETDPPERLAAIRDELARVETKDFWEIVDRGRNFEFMPPEQKKAMNRFFAWFEGVDSEGVVSIGTDA